MARLDFLFNLCFVGLACSSYAVQIHEGQKWLPQIDPSFNGKLPIEWVHVPKCGTSFMSTLLHIPGVCRNIPRSLDSKSEKSIPCNEDGYLIPQSWNCNASVLDTSQFRLNHGGIEDQPPGGYNAGKGRFMMMVRQPEERLLSSYYEKVDESEFRQPVEEYAKQYSGFMTTILTRHNVNPWGSPWSPPTQAEVKEAKIRIQSGFSFIGVADRWALSMCLFNKMFNQVCRSWQFHNDNPTKSMYKPSSGWDTAVLHGYRDPYDNDVYDAAVQIFEAKLKKYNVSESSCEPCWHDANLNVSGNDKSGKGSETQGMRKNAK